MTDVTDAPKADAPKDRKPRFSTENPGDLATLEAEWLKTNKGLDVTPAQVRGVLMFHGEFQKSPERKAQTAAAKEAREAQDAKNKQERADRKAKKEAEDAQKKADKAAAKEKKDADDAAKKAAAEAIQSTGTASESPEGPAKSPAKPRTSKLSKPKPAKVTASAEF